MFGCGGPGKVEKVPFDRVSYGEEDNQLIVYFYHVYFEKSDGHSHYYPVKISAKGIMIRVDDGLEGTVLTVVPQWSGDWPFNSDEAIKADRVEVWVQSYDEEREWEKRIREQKRQLEERIESRRKPIHVTQY